MIGPEFTYLKFFSPCPETSSIGFGKFVGAIGTNRVAQHPQVRVHFNGISSCSKST